MATRHASPIALNEAHKTLPPEAKLSRLVRAAAEANRDFAHVAMLGRKWAGDERWDAAETRQRDTQIELKRELRLMCVDPAELVEALS